MRDKHRAPVETVVLDAAGLAALTRRVVVAADATCCDAAAAGLARRYIVGITGVGGGGKSTLARQLVAEIETRRPGAARLVPMDGFHLSNASLRQRGLADRKGSPPTFDVLAYARLLRAAREGDSPLLFPVYDRQAHEPAWREDAAHRLDAAVRIVVTEGNYLLLADGAWPQVAATLDTCWYLDTPLEQARRWIIERHVRGGRSEAAAEDWYRRVDGPNAQLTLATRDRADLRVVWPGGAAPTTQTLTAS